MGCHPPAVLLQSHTAPTRAGQHLSTASVVPWCRWPGQPPYPQMHQMGPGEGGGCMMLWHQQVPAAIYRRTTLPTASAPVLEPGLSLRRLWVATPEHICVDTNQGQPPVCVHLPTRLPAAASLSRWHSFHHAPPLQKKNNPSNNWWAFPVAQPVADIAEDGEGQRPCKADPRRQAGVGAACRACCAVHCWMSRSAAARDIFHESGSARGLASATC